jgi:hypothetical protein
MDMKFWRLVVAASGGLALLVAAWLGLSVGAGAPAPTARPAAVGATITRTVALVTAQDNTLYESELGAVSNGAGQYLFAGVTQNDDIRRAVLAFDLSGIPPWATVLSATLAVTMSKSIAGPTDVSLHALAAGWGEGASDALGEEGAGALAQPGDATWIYTFYNTDTWATPGGDFAATPSAATTVGDFGRYTWAGTGLLADVAGWAAAPATNFGWILIGDESGPGTAKRFDSRENAPDGPRLTITYVFEGGQTFAPVVFK